METSFNMATTNSSDRNYTTLKYYNNKMMVANTDKIQVTHKMLLLVLVLVIVPLLRVSLYGHPVPIFGARSLYMGTL